VSDISPTILAKIKKCLALSGSSNPHEAAAALRQARALMEKHDVGEHDVAMSEIGETCVDSLTQSRNKSAHWETRLASLVGTAFGCEVLVRSLETPKGWRPANAGGYLFVGLKQQASLAAYTATVLIRKCKTVRAQWLSEHFAGMGRGIAGGKRKMTRMGDMFAEGWVEAIASLVTTFANPPGIDEAIKAHAAALKTEGAQIQSRTIKDPKRHDLLAAHAGILAAQGERLYRPCTADAPAPMIGVS